MFNVAIDKCQRRTEQAAAGRAERERARKAKLAAKHELRAPRREPGRFSLRLRNEARSVPRRGDPPAMSRPRKYPKELIDRGVRLAIESGRPVAHVARDIGLPSETLRKAARRAEADQGLRPDLAIAAAIAPILRTCRAVDRRSV
jgi:transposase-like protein